MDRTAYAQYYALEHAHFWRVARRRMILDLIEMHKPPDRLLRLLDVGGACTQVSYELQRFGELTVVEPDAPTAEFARSELGLDVRVGSLPDDLPVDGTFDVITALDVLEHIDDDVAAARRLRTVLRPGGLLVVTVPALSWLWSAHDVSVHHRRRYVRSGLKTLLEGAGFRIERLSYHTSLLLPVVAAQRLLSRLRGIDPNAKYSVRVPPAPLNAVFGGVMGIERQLLRRTELPIGSSLVAVCRQPATS